MVGSRRTVGGGASGAFAFDGAAGEGEFCDAEEDDVEKLDGDVVDGGGLYEDTVEAPVEDAGGEDAGHEEQELGGDALRYVTLEDETDADVEIDGDLDNENEGVGGGFGPEEFFDEAPVQGDGNEEGWDAEEDKPEDFAKELHRMFYESTILYGRLRATTI